MLHLAEQIVGIEHGVFRDAPQPVGAVRAQMKPVWDGSAFQPRLMLPLCLSYDHRVVDGALAARFLRKICDALADVRQLVL